MKKKEKPIDPDRMEALNIETKAMALVRTIRRNEERKPADQVDHTVTMVTRDKDKLAVMICGSAHRLEDLVVEMLEKRPEMRQVLENAIYRYGQRNQWKL
ncbi:MAG: hypothetical protein E7112_00895 [Bacteroidales bacterium]|nr:hypothetical protein [Bacteroidales bacterium]